MLPRDCCLIPGTRLPYHPAGPWRTHHPDLLMKGAGHDAMLLGHSHQVFPNAASTVPQFNLPGAGRAPVKQAAHAMAHRGAKVRVGR
jgi:hypothetical protein